MKKVNSDILPVDILGLLTLKFSNGGSSGEESFPIVVSGGKGKDQKNDKGAEGQGKDTRVDFKGKGTITNMSGLVEVLGAEVCFNSGLDLDADITTVCDLVAVTGFIFSPQ